MDASKYHVGYFPVDRTYNKWVEKDHIEKSPVWCSVDMRDGNQSLVIPMSLEEKLEYYKVLLEVGFKEIEVGFPAASETEYPAQFDVIVTENMFGDILSDEASMITGSIGMIPSSSLGATSCGLYEPIHGSAPDIAGKDLANPVGTILSAAMMLRYSFDMSKEADAIEAAVSAYLDAGYRTEDIMSEGKKKVGCKQCGELIINNLRKE